MEFYAYHGCYQEEQPFVPVKKIEFLLGFYEQHADALSKGDCKKMLQCLLYGHEKQMVYSDPNFRYQYYMNFYARAQLIIKISPKSIDKIPNRGQNAVFHSTFNIGRLDEETINIINKLSYKLIK